MIKKKEWNKLTEKKQDELSDNAFSYRQCERCNNYYHLGEDEEQNAEGMYLNSPDFECSEQKIIEYEKKHNIYIPYIKEFHTTKKQNYIMAYGGQI
jgi:hypothetical protein